MVHDICVMISDYGSFYWRFAKTSWHNITPMQYGGLLVFIAIVGYMLMRSSK